MAERTISGSFEEFAQSILAEKKAPEDIITLYMSSVDMLATALSGLTEADLDLARADGKWTIRQIVHHIVDGDDIWSVCIKSMIGNPGGAFALDWYDQDSWVKAMEYQKRPINEALALFRARRNHIAELLHHLPDPWEKGTRIVMRQIPEGLQWTVSFTVLLQVCHTLWHIEQIRETRQVHGR